MIRSNLHDIEKKALYWSRFITVLLTPLLFLLPAYGEGIKDGSTADASEYQEKILPDYALKNVKHYHYEEGILRLEVTFEDGEYYSAGQELHIENCSFLYYDIDETLISRGRSKRAKIFSEQSLIIAENDVVIISEVNGGVLETEYLEWHGHEDRFVTDRPVVITRRNGDTISGKGMIADIALRFVTLESDVRGSFRSSGE